jgi:hypothetical protein
MCYFADRGRDVHDVSDPYRNKKILQILCILEMCKCVPAAHQECEVCEYTTSPH